MKPYPAVHGGYEVFTDNVTVVDYPASISTGLSGSSSLIIMSQFVNVTLKSKSKSRSLDEPSSTLQVIPETVIGVPYAVDNETKLTVY